MTVRDDRVDSANVRSSLCSSARSVTGCVVVGDIRRSSQLAEWPRVFARLQGVLGRINQQLGRAVLVRFRPTVGDEFQGALRDPGRCLDLYLALHVSLPAGFYLGIGLGEVERPFRQDLGMRGTAFYRARTAVEECKRRDRAMFLRSADDDGPLDPVVNALFYVLQEHRQRWTPPQRELIGYYREHPTYNYERLAAHFGITKQAAHKRLRAAGWPVVVECEKAIRRLLAVNPEGLISLCQPHEVDGER